MLDKVGAVVGPLDVQRLAIFSEAELFATGGSVNAAEDPFRDLVVGMRRQAEVPSVSDRAFHEPVRARRLDRFEGLVQG